MNENQPMSPPSAAQNITGLQNEMTSLLAQRSQIDDRVREINSIMRGVGMGQRLQDELIAETAAAEKAAAAEARAAKKADKDAR